MTIRARLVDGPKHGQYVTIDDPLPFEFVVDDALYILLSDSTTIDADGWYRTTVYAFSKRVGPAL